MPHLELRTERGIKTFPLAAEPVGIGRHPQNAIVLQDEEASRHHCVIEPAPGGYQVRDLSSRNGTKLNDQMISAAPLGDGDEVRIGLTTLRYVESQNSGPSDAPIKQSRAALPVSSPPKSLRLARAPADPSLPVTAIEGPLREILKSLPAGPFEAEGIGLVDCRGNTLHKAVAGDDDATKEIGEGIRIFRLLLLTCFRARATDLHLEPRTDRATARIRVDGYMVRLGELPLPAFQRLIGMVKILCEVETSRLNVVQDGHFSVRVPDRRVDYRVSLTPSVHGQKLVVRVLDSANAPSRLAELGLVPWMQDKLSTIATRDAGMLLACGPTGSGKTTTLYSCLRELNLDQRNAITIEDPVEYYLEGCTQIPVDDKQNKSFPAILRSVLRQDPDVIFVGEIRDTETATVAMQAAMTGHLVYSTVHAKDTIGAVFRLMDLGTDATLVANAVDLILAQRLVRLLCPHCKRGVRPTPAQNMKMGRALEGVSEVFVPVGCKRCLTTGFHGRRAIFELLEFTQAMRDSVLRSPTIQDLTAIANRGLFTKLLTSGFQLVAEGVTSADEVDRVASGAEV